MAVNNQLQDMYITHQQNIELYKNNLASRAERIYKRGVTRLRSQLRSYTDGDDNIIDSVGARNQIENELLEIMNEINQEFEDFLNKEIEDFTESEKTFYVNTLQETFNSADLVLSVASPRDGLSFSKTKTLPIHLQNGQTARYLEELRNPGLKANRYLRDNIRRAFTLGLSIYVLSNTLFSSTQGIFNSIFRGARTTSNLLVQHATSTTRKTFHEANEETIKGYKWVSVLDSRTSDTCQYLSERVWYYNNPSRSTLPGPIEPPAHYNCRSTTTPIVINSRELSPEAKAAQILSSAALATVLTSRLPQQTSYLQWLKRQPNSIQQEVLGTVRYDLWKSGELQIEGFYSKDARFYTLKELDNLGVDIPNEYLRYVNGDE